MQRSLKEDQNPVNKTPACLRILGVERHVINGWKSSWLLGICCTSC